jgi:hypothetical protein
MVKKDRTFTIKSSCIGVSGGRYKSSSPNGAAKKVGNRLYRAAKKLQKYKNIKRITFVIRESTSGSKKEEYNYRATRVKLAKPLVRTINGVQIVNKFKVTVETMKNKKDIAKKSKVKCNRIPKDMFGGTTDPPSGAEEVPRDSEKQGNIGDETLAATDNVSPAALDEGVEPNGSNEDDPGQPSLTGGASKKRQKKSPRKKSGK